MNKTHDELVNEFCDAYRVLAEEKDMARHRYYIYRDALVDYMKRGGLSEIPLPDGTTLRLQSDYIQWWKKKPEPRAPGEPMRDGFDDDIERRKREAGE